MMQDDKYNIEQIYYYKKYISVLHLSSSLIFLLIIHITSETKMDMLREYNFITKIVYTFNKSAVNE